MSEETPTIFDTPTGALLTEKQVVALTGQAIGLQTLRNWRSTRQGPPYLKLGGSVRYRAGSLIEWLEEQEVRHD